MKKSIILAQKDQEIKDLKTRLKGIEAQQPFRMYQARQDLVNLDSKDWKGSGLILSIQTLDGANVLGPVCIYDGFSKETILELRKEIDKSVAAIRELLSES